MEYLFHISPPLALGPVFKRLLKWFAHFPPFLSHGIGCHFLHVGLEILPFIFEVAE
jgi:hypothetical protein